jgi:hypothetical protein
MNWDDVQTAADETNCDREHELPQCIYYQLISLVQLLGNKYNFVYLLHGKCDYQVFKDEIPNSNTKFRKNPT